MNKTFDCVAFKNQLQERLYEKLNPVDFDDYFAKLAGGPGGAALYRQLLDGKHQRGGRIAAGRSARRRPTQPE